MQSYAPNFIVEATSDLRVAITSQEKLMRVADRYRRKMMPLLIEPIKVAQDSLDVVTLEMLFGMRMPEAVIAYIERALPSAEASFRLAAKNKIATMILEINAAAGNATRCDYTVECLQQFDTTNVEAVTWAEKHAAKLVVEIGQETRLAIREIVVRMFNEGIPPKQAAGMIKKLVGLTSIQSNAVVNLHQRIITANPGDLIYAGKTPIRIPKGGMDDARLMRTLNRYSERLLRQRAMNIARTETVRAANEGQMQLWKQAQKRGELPRDLKHEWIASPTERTCQICIGMNGEIVQVGAQFSAGMTNPPAHPSCRCSTGIVL